MKFVCLGYIEEEYWDSIPQDERNALMDECFAYDDALRRNGHFAGGEALEGAGSAVTLRYQKGKVIVTDGPYAETKEQLGGILILEASDRDHAVELMSNTPRREGRALRDPPSGGPGGVHPRERAEALGPEGVTRRRPSGRRGPHAGEAGAGRPGADAGTRRRSMRRSHQAEAAAARCFSEWPLTACRVSS